MAVSFDVLFVCTGNICRSPMAERLFLARVAPGAPVRAGSAGVGALVGHPMDAPSALVLRELGGTPDGHVARRVTEPMLSRAHLILTADGEHRAALLRLVPAAFRRTFTLREFARLGALPPGAPAHEAAPTDDTLRARVAEVAALRGFAEPAPPGADDIGDPFGAPMDVVRRSGAQVSAAVDAALAALGLAPA